jgi:hypothetical protein
MENTDKSLISEVERMLFLSGHFPMKVKAVSEGSDEPKKTLIKEDDAGDAGGLFGDINDEFKKSLKKDGAGDTSGQKVEIPTALKMAMVLNRLQAEDAKMLGAMTGYEPQTPRIKPDDITGQDTGTYYEKRPVQKLSGAGEELRGMGKEFKPVTFADMTAGLTDEQKKQAMKWLSHKKDRFMISYAGGKLTPTGKSQIEFLARILSGKPMEHKDEAKLLKSPYSVAAKNSSFQILYDFYHHVLIPIITQLGKRAKYTPYDLQLDIMLTEGLMNALEKTKEGKYDPSYGNYGAWIMQAAKNKAIDHLRKITDFKLDETHVFEMLSSMEGPLVITSDLEPEKAYGNYNDVVVSPNNPGYWNYIYQDPTSAIPDFTAEATRGADGAKSSPLKAEHLLNPSLFYKGFAKNLTGAQIDTGGEYEIDTELFPIKTLPAEAKNEIYVILDKVADEIITNYKEYGIKNIASSLRVNKELFKDMMFALLNFGGMVEVYKNSFISKSGSVYPAGTVAKKDESGALEKDNSGRTPETESTWMSRSKGVESVMEDFASKFAERAREKYGDANLPIHFTKNTSDFIYKIYGALRYYFGFRGLENPIVKVNRDKLNAIMKDYEQATLAEARKFREKVRTMLMEYHVNIDGTSSLLDKMAGMIVTCDNLKEFLFGKRATIATGDQSKLDTGDVQSASRVIDTVDNSIEIMKSELDGVTKNMEQK